MSIIHFKSVNTVRISFSAIFFVAGCGVTLSTILAMSVCTQLWEQYRLHHSTRRHRRGVVGDSDLLQQRQWRQRHVQCWDPHYRVRLRWEETAARLRCWVRLHRVRLGHRWWPTVAATASKQRAGGRRLDDHPSTADGASAVRRYVLLLSY